MWRDVDPDHPAHEADNGFEDRFGDLYERMDHMLGRSTSAPARPSREAPALTAAVS
jgi:hypothetical protein